MIRFSLRCHRDHEFEAWFRSSAEFDRGEGTDCPVCGSKKVEKVLMTPSLGRKSNKDSTDKMKVTTAPDPRMRAMREALSEIRRQVTENADNVGDRFAEEARKIHYNEVEPRAIYGEATGEEAKALVEEGIEFQPLPSLPEDQN